MDKETKNCPLCGEEILQVAVKCKHCGSMLGELPSGGTTIIDAFTSQYEILGELGRGGMSTVYKARQIALDRIVALKVVPKEFTHDKDFVARLRREAQSSAMLSHPNIVTTYDVGELGGYPYITLEYLSGGTLSEFIHKHGKLSEDQIKKIIIPILEGLSYAHAKGIVHRDIKSSNIMFNEHQHPILMDFGIARSTEGTKLTKTGTTIGTPEYMSPEQAMGKDTDLRSDLYSIGVVMYEMATCNVPFRAETGFGVIHKVVNEEPDLKLLQSDNSESLISIISKLLVKSTEQRFQLDQEAISALQQKQIVQIITPRQLEKNTDSTQTKFIPPLQPTKSTQETVFIKHGAAQTKYQPELKSNPIYDKTSPKTSGKRKGLFITLTIMFLVIIIWVIEANGNKHRTNVSQDVANSVVSSQATAAPQEKRQSGLVEMIYVAGGNFTMGDTFGDGESDEKPTHTVSLSSFYIGKYEVTQSQWQTVMGSNPSNFKGDNKPVEGVNWYDAIEFCNKLSEREGLTPCYSINGANTICDGSANGYRLPTEAEWEYAAKGGNSGNGCKYSGSNDLSSVAWYSDNSGSQTHSVGQKQSNELGIYDLSGNVWEWCWDWYNDSYYNSSPGSNPRGAGSGEYRALRGGSWNSSDRGCRVAFRFRSTRGDRYDILGGLRVCRAN